MPLTNALLIRAAYGWDEATDAASIGNYGRREALYGLGSYTSPVDVARTAQARLNLISTPRYQYDAEQDTAITPEADFAYHGYGVGDTLPVTEPGGSPSSERVQSIAVSEDQDNGRAFVTASLHDIVMYASPIDNFLAMLATATKKMIPGTGRGDWPEAQPVTPPAAVVSSPPLQPGICYCGIGPVSYPSNPLSGTFGSFAGPGFINSSSGPGVTSCPDVVDQRVELDFIGTWGTTAGDWIMWVRRSTTGLTGGDPYAYMVYGHTQAPFTNETRTLVVAKVGGAATTLDAGTFLGDARPQAGDTFELSAIGSAIAFKVNGVTQLSATDSSVVHPAGAALEMGTAGDAFDSSSGAVSLDLITEDFCP